MKIKKIITSIIFVLTILVLTSCSLIKEDKNITVEEKSVKFTNYSDEYDIKATSMKAYFIDSGVTPYVEGQNFMETLDGFSDMSNITFTKSGLFSEFRINLRLQNIVTVSTIFNWDKNTIRFTDLYATQISKEGAQTDFMKHLKVTSENVKGGGSVTLELEKYGFDILYNEGRVLIPFSIMNFIYCSQNYYNIYYNGSEFAGDYLAIGTKSSEYQTVYKTELRGQQPSQELRNETYNFMSFVMHYYYGLNDMNPNVESDLKSLEAEIRSTDPKVFMGGEAKFINQKLNELHSGLITLSYYMNPSDYISADYQSESATNTRAAASDLASAKAKNYGADKFPVVRFSSNTAIIFFDEFSTAATSDIYNEDGSVKDKAYEKDTYELFRYAFTEIKKHSEIQNVVIDLSQNGGGNLAALLKTLGFLTNDEVFYTTYNLLNGRKSFMGVKSDVLDNGKYGEDAYTGYKYFIQTSLLTYSSANIMSGISKNYKYATIIGQKSGGGMCSILPVVFPDGTTVQISSTNQSRIKVKTDSGYDLVPIEKGVEVDIQIDYKDYYNDAKLVQIISQA